MLRDLMPTFRAHPLAFFQGVAITLCLAGSFWALLWYVVTS